MVTVLGWDVPLDTECIAVMGSLVEQGCDFNDQKTTSLPSPGPLVDDFKFMMRVFSHLFCCMVGN